MSICECFESLGVLCVSLWSTTVLWAPSSAMTTRMRSLREHSGTQPFPSASLKYFTTSVSVAKFLMPQFFFFVVNLHGDAVGICDLQPGAMLPNLFH